MLGLPKLLISLPVISAALMLCQQLLAQEWRPVRGGTPYGISGIVMVKQQKDGMELLVVHDNKKPDQGRLAMIAIAGAVQPQYKPIKWQQNANLPLDLEALTIVPHTSTYMAMTSAGKIYHFHLKDDDSISVLKVFALPKVPPNSNLESFALTEMNGELVAVWADRGNGSQPAILYWGRLNLATYTVTLVGSTPVTVPLTGAEVRHISDLKVDEAGVVYITAASDGGDDEPFRSSVYIVGALGHDGKQWMFRQNSKLVPIFHDNYHKIEAIALLPGATGGVILGTDDEAMGGSVMLMGSEQ